MLTVTIQKSAKTVNATVGYHDLHCGQKYILMINQAIHSSGLENHLLCPMQCCLIGVHISEVPKFQPDSPSVTTLHPIIIPLHLSSVSSYFDVYFMSVSEYENEDILKTHLIAEESPWYSSTEEYSECKTHMSDQQGQIIRTATVARQPVFISARILYSMAYHVFDFMDNDNLATLMPAQKKVSIALMA